MGLAILMCILQGSAIHGIYNKYFGLIIFNCVFKYLYLLLCFGLFIVASYAYTMRVNELKNVNLYEKIMSLSFFGILYYGFQAYLLMEIACTLPKIGRRNIQNFCHIIAQTRCLNIFKKSIQFNWTKMYIFSNIKILSQYLY